MNPPMLSAAMSKFLLFFAIAVLVLSACRKEEKCPTNEPAAVDGRDRFVGTYSVYNLAGTYLYSMTISKFGSGGRDSLLLSNIADTFDLRVLHERYFTTNYLGIGLNFPALDQAGNRWAFFGSSGETGLNTLMNDSIRLGFTMDNIAFYFEDGVPFYSCECRQIAVKGQ